LLLLHRPIQEVVRSNGDGTCEVIVLQKSDNMPLNQRSWKSFREEYDLEARRERIRERKLSVPLSVSPAPSPHQPLTPNYVSSSPSTSEESDLSQSPIHQWKKARRGGLGDVPEGEVIDLTGEVLVHAKQFKRSLQKKGKVRLTIVGDDGIPYSCVIPSDSEAETETEFDERLGPWSQLDSAEFEI
jgi:hypothetical protein